MNNQYWSLDCDILAGPPEASVKIAEAGTPSIAADIVKHLNIAPGAAMIAAERKRHTENLPWDEFHDDLHPNSELVDAGIGYAHCAALITQGGCGWDDGPDGWPFEEESWRPSPCAIRNLVKAGSFFAAEIDRLLRANEEIVIIGGKTYTREEYRALPKSPQGRPIAADLDDAPNVRIMDREQLVRCVLDTSHKLGEEMTENRSLKASLSTERELRECAEKNLATLAAWLEGNGDGWPLSGHGYTIRKEVEKMLFSPQNSKTCDACKGTGSMYGDPSEKMACANCLGSGKSSQNDQVVAPPLQSSDSK